MEAQAGYYLIRFDDQGDLVEAYEIAAQTKTHFLTTTGERFSIKSFKRHGAGRLSPAFSKVSKAVFDEHTGFAQTQRSALAELASIQDTAHALARRQTFTLESASELARVAKALRSLLEG